MDDLKSNPFWERNTDESELKQQATESDMASTHGYDGYSFQPSVASGYTSPIVDEPTSREYVDSQLQIGDVALDTDTGNILVADASGSWLTINPASEAIDLQNINGTISVTANSIQINTPTGTVDILQKLNELEQEVNRLTGMVAVDQEPKTKSANGGFAVMAEEIRSEIDKDLIEKIMALANEIDHATAFSRAMKGV